MFQRHVELLKVVQRFAQLAAKFGGYLVQSIKHMILVARLRFRARQRFAVRAVDRFDGEKVRRADLGDGTLADGGAPNSLTKVLGYVWRELGVWLVAHQPQSLVDLLIRDDAEEG